jgi:hypothetical protein
MIKSIFIPDYPVTKGVFHPVMTGVESIAGTLFSPLDGSDVIFWSQETLINKTLTALGKKQMLIGKYSM